MIDRYDGSSDSPSRAFPMAVTTERHRSLTSLSEATQRAVTE